MKVSLQYQKIEKSLQKINEQVEEFFSSPYKNERTISFLNGKAIAYRKVLDILNKEICDNCGFTFSSHCAASYCSLHCKMYIPQGYCPGHEGRMDWDNGQGTTFKPTGRYKMGG